MPLFQTSVLKKYLSQQDTLVIEKAFGDFSGYFLNPEIQRNIRDSKEEQFQEGFLRELFVKILGYTLNPDTNFNLTTELKNEKGSKKTDGAILKDGKALGVVELKGTDTKDLDKVNEQAFSYKNNHRDCVYVITSNFEKLRFFIHNAVEHIEFNLFTLTLEEFKVLWLCLHVENLLNGIPLKVKDESLLAEENITKQLYKEYSAFKTALWQNMVKNHPHDDALMLFKKTQKLLDRFLFVFFAEDSGLLPPNSIRKIIDKWNDDTDWGEDRRLYDIYKQYFEFINSGRPAKGERAEIFAYNGGLFNADFILDNINIDDEVLLKYTEKLSTYDFQSEVDVNILGHIFENSLNEIENITAELEGQKIDKSKSKRKKDGIFYTPKYITKYIIDTTIGKLCEEKKAELNISDERFGHASKRSRKGIVDLQTYRDWLLGLKICDPACGSGAFLNQALEFLIDEHRYLDELTAQYHKSPLVLSDIETQILEQNIYGVDINEESVEIAKLSLWLRTAQRGRKLTSLNKNIKCGNSLIDDMQVAGKEAFNWQKEFPTIFDNGGFDAVIGNPPYVSSKGENFIHSEKEFLTRHYSTAAYQIDLYMLFMERGLSLQNIDGVTSLIVPNSWLNNLFLETVRKFMLTKSTIHEIVSMPSGTFESAYVDTVIVTYTRKLLQGSVRLIQCINSEFVFSGEADKNEWLESKGSVINVHLDKVSSKIIVKLEKLSVTLASFTEIARGVGVYHKRVGHSKELIVEDPFQSVTKKDKTFVPYLRGRNLAPWLVTWNDDSFISYGNWLAEPRELKYFEGPRLVLRQIPAQRLVATYIDSQFITDQSVFIAKFNRNSQFNPKAVLCILNSELMSYYFRLKYSEFDDLFPKVKLQHFKDFPIAKSAAENSPVLVRFGDARLSAAADSSEISANLITLLKSKFDIEKPSKKLQNWHELDFKDFLKELKKAKIQLCLSEEAEWMQYFNEQKQKVQELKWEIEQIDSDIDKMVYQLYGLTEEEIKVVEGGYE